MEILKIKNATKIINSKDGFDSILVIREDKIGELRDKSVELSKRGMQKGWGDTEWNMEDIWERIKNSYKCVIGVQEERDNGQHIRKIKIITSEESNIVLIAGRQKFSKDANNMKNKIRKLDLVDMHWTASPTTA